jgi:hypothetical protein
MLNQKAYSAIQGAATKWECSIELHDDYAVVKHVNGNFISDATFNLKKKGYKPHIKWLDDWTVRIEVVEAS